MATLEVVLPARSFGPLLLLLRSGSFPRGRPLLVRAWRPPRGPSFACADVGVGVEVLEVAVAVAQGTFRSASGSDGTRPGMRGPVTSWCWRCTPRTGRTRRRGSALVVPFAW
uniref:(northern house mosquito) hypothetical protein n=1 Tax=Culex pipiens TaxID=7175 RepID=A0A8D8CVR8_CULPI